MARPASFFHKGSTLPSEHYAPHPVTGEPTLVPYVVMWDSEVPVPLSLLTVAFAPEPRLTYHGPALPEDRCGFGALWARVSSSPGVGTAHFANMHPARQYICMYSMKCQVCKGPASRNRDGWLFFDWRKELDPPTWPEGAVTAMPPLCDAHAKMSRELCPRLGKGHFAELRVKTPRLWGAGGTHYRLTAGGWQTDEADVWAPKGDTSLRALLVSKLIRELRDVTVIDMR